MAPEDVERRVAQVLAYLRRRVDGDYDVDDFGYDADFTENVFYPMLRPIYRHWFRVEVRGIENIPSSGGALVVSNHSGTIALDSLMVQLAIHDEHPEHRVMRALGADLVFSDPLPRHHRPPVRVDPRDERRRRAALRPGGARRRLPRGLQGRRQALPRAVQAPALRPRRLRRRGARGAGADRPVLRRRRRGDRADHRQHGHGGPAAGPAVRAGHADLPLARPARPGPAAEQVDHRVRRPRSPPTPRPPAPPTTRCSSSTSPTRCARRSSRRCTPCSCSGGRCSSDAVAPRPRHPHRPRGLPPVRHRPRDGRPGHRRPRRGVGGASRSTPTPSCASGGASRCP